MALPTSYSNSQQYFEDAIDFLRTYSWIYQDANTCCVKAEVLERLQSAFQNYFLDVSNEDLNEFPVVHSSALNISQPTLTDFRTKLKRLTPETTVARSAEDPTILPTKTTNLRKTKLKKQHEIERLAQLINVRCADSDLLIDLGSGLGYLCEMIHSLNQRFLIFGLEAHDYRVETAQRRTKQNLPQAEKSIVYKQMFVNEDSRSAIEARSSELAALNNLQQPHMAIIGLHACADLTITSIKLFFSMDSVRTLLIMPCCYHKLEMRSAMTFVNFPLSKCLKKVVAAEEKSGRYLNRPFLRLACQQTMAPWLCTTAQEHEAHGRQMFWRSVAEALLDETEMVLKQTGKRKGKADIDYQEIMTFKMLCEHYPLKSRVTGEPVAWNDSHAQKFQEIVQKYKDGPKLAEGLTCLQTAMQKLCENVVLYDRVCYMQEYASTQGLQINVRCEKLFNEKISPRCQALIAEKLC